MISPKFLALILLLALATAACRFGIQSPIKEIKTGPTQTEAIEAPAPDAETASLRITFGAGQLNLKPGAENALVKGTATYNIPDLKPRVVQNGNQVRIETGDLKVKGIPSFGKDMVNRWDLKLGSQPMDLVINAGAYQGEIELGGLALKSLEVGDGAADTHLQFSDPNKVEMSSFRYETGASKVVLTGLGNANFADMIFRSGAGDYTLDFSGALKRDASVRIESGISHVVLIVPKGVSARVNFEGGLSNVTTNGDWSKSGNAYTQQGSGPTLSFDVSMGAGDLELRNN